MIEDYLSLEEQLIGKIKVLSEVAWDRRCDGNLVKRWQGCFDGLSGLAPESEKIQMLYLLSNFLYFGNIEVKELLRAVYRDLFKYRIISGLRKRNQDSTDESFLTNQFNKEPDGTVFIGTGGSEASSGKHLLYTFRHANGLEDRHFPSTDKLLSAIENSPGKIRRCIFLDDFAGTGQQAIDYAAPVASAVLQRCGEVENCYYVLVSTDSALSRIRGLSGFTEVDCVLELTTDFQAFSQDSLYFIDPPPDISRRDAQQVAMAYGARLDPHFPFGFGEGQLLLGFHHNTPDNTLPVLRSEKDEWVPPFPRNQVET